MNGSTLSVIAYAMPPPPKWEVEKLPLWGSWREAPERGKPVKGDL